MRHLLTGALLVLVACTAGSDTTDDEAPPASASGATPGSTADTSTPEEEAGAPNTAPRSDPHAGVESECDDLDRVRLVRGQSIPGGHRLHLQVTDPDGAGVAAADVERCVALTSDRLGVLDTAVASAPNEGGATLIVARWSPADVDASRTAIDEMLATLPPGEQVAVWAWSDDVVQVVGSTTDRDRITRRLDAVWTADDAVPLDAATTAEIASEEWEDFRDDSLLGIRSVVFVAPTLDLGERPDIDRDVVVDHWIVRSGDGGRVVDTEGGSVGDAAERVVDRIVRDRNVGLTVVDTCDDGESLDLTVFVGERSLRDFGIGDAAVEHVGVPCAIGEAGVLGSPPLDSIVVTFDATERSVFDGAVAVADELSGRDRFDGDIDPEWTGSISLDGGATSAPFDASFRGQSSIECERRNWSVDLEGGDARHPVAGSGTDEFVLASLCNDEGYVNTLTGSAVMAEFDTWSQARGTTAFSVDGAPRGVYLLIEDPDVDLRFETSRVTTVLRRRYDALGRIPDVEYVADLTSNDDETILATYDALVEVAASTSGDDKVAALRARFDLDQYLRWTAVMSLLGSGDHIDELYFVGSESVNAQHEPIIWFTVNGWDPDDLFAPCHREGRLAIDDPNGLLSCTESLLDQQLFADDVVYDLYAATLAEVMAEMTPERFAEIVDESAMQVTRHLDDADVAAASVELAVSDSSVITPDVATDAVDAAARELTDRFGERRSTLLDLLAAYEAAS